MIIHNSYPTEQLPCLVQINLSPNSGFFLAENFQDGLDSYCDENPPYIGNLVAIFKCKPKP